MKIKKLLFALFAISLIIGGCAEVEELTDVTFNAEFKADLNCEVPLDSVRAGIDGAFATNMTIDPLSDPNAEKYIDKIKSWKVTGLSGEILSVSKEGVNLLSTDVEVFSANYHTSWQLPKTPLIVGQKISFDNGSGQWDIIDGILGDKDEFTISMNGTTDEDDVSFVIRILVQTKVTANPL